MSLTARVHRRAVGRAPRFAPPARGMRDRRRPGGTRCHGLLADLTGMPLAPSARPTADEGAPVRALLATIRALRRRARELGLPVAGLPVGVAAVVDPETGLAWGGPHVHWDGSRSYVTSRGPWTCRSWWTTTSDLQPCPGLARRRPRPLRLRGSRAGYIHRRRDRRGRSPAARPVACCAADAAGQGRWAASCWGAACCTTTSAADVTRSGTSRPGRPSRRARGRRSPTA